MVETQAITVRLPSGLYEELRSTAFKSKRPMSLYVLEGVRQRLKGIDPERFGQLCALFEAAWHHTVPDFLDDLPPVTSPDARKLAMLATEVMSR